MLFALVVFSYILLHESQNCNCTLATGMVSAMTGAPISGRSNSSRKLRTILTFCVRLVVDLDHAEVGATEKPCFEEGEEAEIEPTDAFGCLQFWIYLKTCPESTLSVIP